jgi:hypothetical protein
MGNALLSDDISDKYPMKVSQFEISKSFRNSIGPLQTVTSVETKTPYTLLTISFDNDETFKSLRKSLDDLLLAKKLEQEGYIQAWAIEINDRRLYCSSSSFTIVLDHFQLNLEDVIRANYLNNFFSYECQVWNFLFSIVKVIQFNSRNNVEGHFIHPRSICLKEDGKQWGVLHSAFFSGMTNYSESKAGNLNFCSPELFSQVSLDQKRFNCVDQDKSDMFSLGLVALFILSYQSNDIDMSKVYYRGQWIVDGLYLQRVINNLERLNISDLMIRVLGEMLQELENLRMSSDGFLDFLVKHQEELVDINFKAHDKLMDNFMELKSSQMIMSINKEYIKKEGGMKIPRPSTVLSGKRDPVDVLTKTGPEKSKISEFFSK